jgi:hypothetical protein
MDHTFPVIVVENSDDPHKPGANVAGAMVALVEKIDLASDHHPFPDLDPTHNDAGGGKYAETSSIDPLEGDWGLVVTLAGKSPVFQPLKFKKGKDGEFTVSPQPSAVATVTITGAIRKVGGSKVKEITFHVTLFPAAEIVFIAGVDYNVPSRDVSKGWQFHEYAFNRAEVLRREKKIDAGTIVTVFSTSKIRRIKRVWGVKQWVDVEVTQLGDPTTRTLPADLNNLYQPEAGLDIHITDFYKYLAEVGARAPKSVKEIGIFSHSYPGGPILYDTVDPNPGISAARNDQDFDARPKDFNSVNFTHPAAGKPDYSGMPKALSDDCRFTIWGCSATTHFKFASRNSLRAINAGQAEDAFFDVSNELEDHGRIFATEQERTSEIRHRWLMDSLFRQRTYAAEAAKALNIEVRAGCPGTGSDPKTVEGIEMLMVDFSLYQGVFDYFHKKFAPEFAETNGKWDKGYVDYHALQTRAVVARPPFSSEYFYFEKQLEKTHFQPAGGATLRFWNFVTVNHPTSDVTLAIKSVADLVTPGVNGHLYILNDKDKTKSQAVYVQDDEHIFQITQDPADPKHEWKVKGAELFPP